jgi:nitrogen regulatory protein PII
VKHIIAFIKEHKLSEVTLALHKVEGLTGMSVTDAKGFGRGWGKRPDQHPKEDPGDFRPTCRVELFCRDDLAEELVRTIETAAHTGLRGDGKIYVLPVEEAVRISTGERGETAV